MRILFLQSLTYPFIGVMSISAVLRKSGHQTRLHFLDFNRPAPNTFQQIRKFAPDLIAIPVYTGWQRGILNFCRQLKDRTGLPVILGGPHPTHCPEILADEAVDYLCLGEAEVSFPELLNRLEHGQTAEDIPGIWLKKNGAVIGNGVSQIMDPRTGYPARGSVSVSVMAPRTIDSEAWAKPFFVNGRQWAARHMPKNFRVFFCEDRMNQPCAWLQ